MMNDALEYYLHLTDLRIVGSYQTETAIETARIIKEEQKYLLIMRQINGNVFTLHFKEIEEYGKCYQYHNIGHFWVKGQEQWRQLVYIIGTIRDKYEYFGDLFCNDVEREIMNLIHFAPFHAWSPIHESLTMWYRNENCGLETMEKLSIEAEDDQYLQLVKLYRKFPFRWMGIFLSKQLLNPNRQRLYELIWDKVEQASKEYPCRDYGEIINRNMEAQRRGLQQKLIGLGYSGCYPCFEKSNRHIIAAEQHPFTIMEWEHYDFKIQLMISEYEGQMASGRNAGFFRGKGRKGWISDVTDID